MSSVGEVLILTVMVGILKALKADFSTENNTKAFSVLIAFSGGVWRMCTLYKSMSCNDSFNFLVDSPVRAAVVLS